MNSNELFDWETLEMEDKRSKGNLSRSDYEKIGITSEILEAYESTYDRLIAKPKKNQLVTGRVVVVDAGTKNAIIDISSTEDAYLDLSKEDSKYLEYIQPGFDITLKIINDPSKKGYINTSFTEAAKVMKEREIFNSIGEDIAYMGRVDRLVSGGYIVNIDDVEVFMPGSLAGVNKLHDFNILLGKNLIVKPVNYERGNIVVSHRDYLHTLIPTAIEELKENLSQSITGFVTGTTKYGVFCQLNECLTGMILISDLTEDWKEKHSNKDIKPGDEIEFFVKEIVNPRKIILTQVFKEDPWETIDKKYKVPCEATGLITSIKEYGAFIKLEEGIVGLLHQTEFEEHSLNEGEEIKVNITRIDKSTKKIYLKLA